MTAQNRWYLLRNDEIVQIPYYLMRTLRGEETLTRTFGIYIFINNFELTGEARYLKEMFRYKKLTPTAQKKVDAILELHKPWVRIDTEFKKALEERENDNKN